MERKILIGTTNPSKIHWLKEYLKDIPGIKCVTLKDLGVTVEAAEEGSTPEENALLKALAYHKASGLAVVSHDSGLYFREFSMEDPRQPGLHIRRVAGKTLDDDGMMAYYSKLVQPFGLLHACYLSGFAVMNESGQFKTFRQDDLNNDWYYQNFGFLLCSQPHEKRHPGWPLDSLSKDLHTGQYWFDQVENDSSETQAQILYRGNVAAFFSSFLAEA